MGRCHCRHHHLCGYCASKQAAKLPVAATAGVLAVGAAPYVGAWKLGKALFGKGSWTLSPEARRVRDERRARRAARRGRPVPAEAVPQARWSDRR